MNWPILHNNHWTLTTRTNYGNVLTTKNSSHLYMPTVPNRMMSTDQVSTLPQTTNHEMTGMCLNNKDLSNTTQTIINIFTTQINPNHHPRKPHKYTNLKTRTPLLNPTILMTSIMWRNFYGTNPGMARSFSA